MSILTKIANLTADELNAQKDALIQEAVGIDPAELSARMLQFLIDAKTRDQKLAEQGEAIRLLGLGLTQAEQANKALSKQLDQVSFDAREAHNAAKLEIEQRGKEMQLAIDLLNKRTVERDNERARAERLRKASLLARGANAAAHKLLSDAMTAQAIADADVGGS